LTNVYPNNKKNKNNNKKKNNKVKSKPLELRSRVKNMTNKWTSYLEVYTWYIITWISTFLTTWTMQLIGFATPSNGMD
jgi:hypothetical protein